MMKRITSTGCDAGQAGRCTGWDGNIKWKVPASPWAKEGAGSRNRRGGGAARAKGGVFRVAGRAQRRPGGEKAGPAGRAEVIKGHVNHTPRVRRGRA